MITISRTIGTDIISNRAFSLIIMMLFLWWQILLCSSFSPTPSLHLYRNGVGGVGRFSSSSTTTTTKTQLYNTQLNTNLEWLFEERYEANKVYYQSIQWHDPSQPLLLKHQKESDEDVVETTTAAATITMPLYPLGATYLPTTNINYTLNNVEPRNIQMALDLLGLTEGASSLVDDTTNTNATSSSPSPPPPLFCAVLSAADTGRIALVGTILEIIDYQIQRTTDLSYYDNNPKRIISRIQLTCQPRGVVDICTIINPNAYSKENRIKRSTEYLIAKVAPRPNQQEERHRRDDDDDIIDQQLQQLEAKFEQLIDDFSMLQLMYQLDLGMSKEELPPGTLRELGNAMPSWKDHTFDMFWDAAQDWQSVLYTIRQGRQSMLNAERNERMIAAATAKGGPLKLPVHMEDLDPSVRREIQEMENIVYKNFLELELDPCLDFQALISQRDQHDQIDLLSHMISRERRRVEIAAKQPRRVAISDDPDLSLEF